MIEVLILVQLCVVMLGIWAIMRQMDIRWKLQIEREGALRKWLFDSLYSIDQKVLLPTEHEKPMSSKKAKVYSPEDDPMSEFTGQMSDL